MWNSETKDQPIPSFPMPEADKGPAMPTPPPSFPGGSSQHPMSPPPFPDDKASREPHGDDLPPAYSPPPPSGYRIPLDTASSAPFPPIAKTGYPPFFDADGTSPVFLGSAIFPNAVHPCKVAPSLQPPCRVPYGGGEHEHRGRYDLLPFVPETMEWVQTSKGRIPRGKRPVEGGYEDHGAKLYHAVATINGVPVPGKTGEHLGGCNVAFGGGEHVVRENYDILCWKV